MKENLEIVLETVFVFGLVSAFIVAIGAMIYFSNVEANQRDRELTIRERETELKAQQYPYENKIILEAKTP